MELVPLRDGKKRESKTMELGTKNSDAPVAFQRSRPGCFDGQALPLIGWNGLVGKVDPASNLVGLLGRPEIGVSPGKWR